MDTNPRDKLVVPLVAEAARKGPGGLHFGCDYGASSLLEVGMCRITL
jgi:hypothetical protein